VSISVTRVSTLSIQGGPLLLYYMSIVLGSSRTSNCCNILSHTSNYYTILCCTCLTSTSECAIMIVEDKTITSSPFGADEAGFTGGSPVRAISIDDDSHDPVLFRQTYLKLLDPNPAPHDFKACPRCSHPPRPGEVRHAGV